MQRSAARRTPTGAAAGSSPDMAYLVTGATGFIGRHLVAALLQREGDIYVVVREGSLDKLQALVAGQWVPVAANAAERVKPLVGDLATPRLGVPDEQVDQLRAQVDHLFHLAASYDMTADEETNRIANVEGTRHAVELA